MNETLNPRNTRGGQPASGREDPLAELARIVGAEDPFANLFHDARRVPENVRREEHTLQDLAARQDPAKRDQPAYDEVEDGFTGELRGAYDDHDRPRPVRSHPSIRPTYDEGGPAPLRGALDGGFSRFDEDEDEAVEDGYDAAYADDGYGDEGEAVIAAPEPKPRGSVFAKAATAIVLIVAAGGGVIAWKSNLFETGSLPGGGKPPMIMASEEPAKVKPEIVAANDAKPSTKEIFDRPNAVKPAAPDKVLSREEQPVALSVASAEPSEPKLITRSVTPVSAGQTASAPLDPAPAGPLPPSSAAPEPMPVSSSIEPRRVRTVKVLADGTVVTGEATAPVRALPADIPAGVPSLASEQADSGTPTTATIPHISASAPLPPAAPAIPEKPASPQMAMADIPGVGDAANDASDATDTSSDPAPIHVQTEAIETPSAVPPVRPRNIPVAASPARPKPVDVKAVDAKAIDVKPIGTRPADAASSRPVTPTAVAQQAQKPMRVASLAPSPAPAAPAASAGGAWVVQVASQKSQSDATSTFQALERKFPGVIGGMKPPVKQADLGDKGTFYRVRLGAWSSREDATAFCVKLKSAGGDCVVTRN